MVIMKAGKVSHDVTVGIFLLLLLCLQPYLSDMGAGKNI